MILVVVEEGGNNVHEICLLHFMRQEITCFSVEQCNKEGNEDNIVPPACQGPVSHFSQKPPILPSTESSFTHSFIQKK